MCRCDEHFVRYPVCVCGIDGHSDSGKDVQVVCLGRQECMAIKMNWRELHSSRINGFPFRPGIRIRRQAFVLLDRIREGENDRPSVVPRHSLDDFAREELSYRAYADEDRGFEFLDGRKDLRILRRQIQMIEGFAGRQLMRIGPLRGFQAWTASDHKALCVEQPDLLASGLWCLPLLTERGEHEGGKPDRGRPQT